MFHNVAEAEINAVITKDRYNLLHGFKKTHELKFEANQTMPLFWDLKYPRLHCKFLTVVHKSLAFVASTLQKAVQAKLS